MNLTGGSGADLVLESSGGPTFHASLAATRRVTGRVVVFGLAGGEGAITNWDLVYRHQVHVIGLNLGVLSQAAPQIFGRIMGELSALIAAGAVAPLARRSMHWPTARRRSRTWKIAPRLASLRWCLDASAAARLTCRPIRCRDRAISSRAAGPLLSDGRLRSRGRGSGAGDLRAGLAFLRSLRTARVHAELVVQDRHQRLPHGAHVTSDARVALRTEGPFEGPARPPDDVAPGEVAWLEPLPDGWTAAPADDPDATVIARESLRLALIASLQYLPVRQRAIFLLREVLAFSADETAEVLGISTVAVKSGLQRARARLGELAPAPETLLEPTDPRARELLDGYIAAFERSDASLLVKVLRTDASLESTPFRDWVVGRARCIHLLETYVLATAGTWRMLATVANGQPAAAIFRRDAAGMLRADGIVVLTTTAPGVSRVTAFHDGALVALFGFPVTLGD